ncbi:hypothetical protein EIP91_006172 [Steccherinum ochraceum]|uniref:A-factor receptor n=1 Tax=Steccherinum ochraceum TaxID=92696 RepID=A0A4R0RC14_9APHY|nr:hypothetical protein EIP91_006172 [Steccherinum ochraceum]
MSLPSLSAGSFIAAVLVLVPLPAHWRARNVATVSLITWLFLTNFIYFVNSLVWSDNSVPRIRVWCDIVTKLMIGASSAIPAATLCICKHLELVASGRMVRLSHEDHRRRRIFELLFCWGVPVLFMILHYIVQGHRFDIVEAIGCQPAVYYSIPAVFIIWFPPLLLSVLTLIYSTLALSHFLRQRITFATHLSSSGSSLNTNRYLRLMAMAMTEICWGSSLNAVAMYDNISPGLRPWTNWADVHSDFGRIATFRLFEIAPAYLRQMLIIWWAIPVSAYIFFIFFAFGEDTKNDYKRVVAWVMRVVFRMSPSAPNAKMFDSLSSQDSYSRRVFVHKPSSAATHSDADDTLPCYTSSTGSTAYSPTSSEDKSASLTHFHPEKDDGRALPSVPSSPISTTSSATESSVSPQIVVSDAYPASRPPTPMPARPHDHDFDLEIRSTRVSYQRPFGPPSIVRIDPARMSTYADDAGRAEAGYAV